MPPGDTSAPRTFRALVRDLRRQAREHRALPFAVTVDGVFAGQVTVTNIVGGSAQWAQVGYWIDRRYAGQGVIPTAVALVVDHCLLELGLHRIEVAIRPENTASLRVVEKLGFTEVGYAPRLPAHRRRLARPPAVRDHRRGVRRRAAAPASRPPGAMS